MIRNTEELSIAIKAAVNRRSVVVSHLTLALAITLHTVLWPSTLAFERYLAVGISIAIVLAAFIRFFDLASINNRPLVYVIFYEILTFIGVTFLTEPATPYVLVPFLTALIVNVFYGAKGVYATVAVFGAATVSKYFFLQTLYPLTTENTLDIFVAFFVFAAVSSFFINIQSVYDWDRTRLKGTIKAATIEQKRLHTLINNMTESVLVLDRSGVVKLYNAAALALFNTNTSLEGKALANFAVLENEKGASLKIGDLLPQDNKPLHRSDVLLRYGQEDVAALSITVTQLKTSFGEGDDYTGYILTLRDVTREKSLEEERNEFISVISHELRTPVTVTEASLSNALMMHDKYGGSDEVKKTIVTAHDQALFLAKMLNDLSTFARAEKGTLELDLEEINPSELVNQLEADHRKEAEAKGLQLTVSLPESISETLVSNRLYIREILQNFITNAIKYSDEGKVTITAGPNPNGGVCFSVSDQGIGISTSDQKKVFNKFFRSEDFRTRSRSGTGLGLYIVRKLTKLIKGKISMTSELGKGSTFRLDVPDLRAELEAHSHHASREAIVSSVPDQASEIPVDAAPASQQEDIIKLTDIGEQGDQEVAEMERSLAAVIEQPSDEKKESAKDDDEPSDETL